MKILIADDHAMVRDGLKQLLTKLTIDLHIDEVSNGVNAIKLIKNNDYDFVILDISLPDISGLDILKRLKEHNNPTKVLILSMHPEEQFAVRALKLGAMGYITKDRAGEELLGAIRKISCGAKYVSPELTEYMVSNLGKKAEENAHQMLSDREFQIMILLAKGKSSREIAGELFISEKTVGTHRFRILQKMGLKKNTDLTFYAINNKLIDQS